jgi:hypothetical protein
LLREGTTYGWFANVAKSILMVRLQQERQNKKGVAGTRVYANYQADFPTAPSAQPKIAKDVADNAKVHDTAALINQGIVNSLTLKPGRPWTRKPVQIHHGKNRAIQASNSIR